MKLPIVRWIAVAAAAAACVVVIGLAVTPNAAAPEADGDEFTGRWIVTGTDPRGVEYAGSLIIEPDEAGYSLRWIITGGTRLGSAAMVGNELSGEWVQLEGIDGELTGTARISVDGGTLISAITIDGVSGSGTETGSAAR